MTLVSACARECRCDKLSASAGMHFPWDANNVSKKSNVTQIDVPAPTYYQYFLSWALSEIHSFYIPTILEKKLPKDIAKTATFRAVTIVSRLHKIISHLVYRHWNFIQTFLFSDLISMVYLHLYWLSLDFELIDPRKSPELFSALCGHFKEWNERELVLTQSK